MFKKDKSTHPCDIRVNRVYASRLNLPRIPDHVELSTPVLGLKTYDMNLINSLVTKLTRSVINATAYFLVKYDR